MKAIDYETIKKRKARYPKDFYHERRLASIERRLHDTLRARVARLSWRERIVLGKTLDLIDRQKQS